MFDTTIIVVSVVVLLSVFLQPGITAHSIKDSSSEADSSSQLKEGRKFQVKENMRLRDEQESERQRIKTLENVISAHSEEIQQHKRKSKPLQEKTKKVTATYIGSIGSTGLDDFSGIAKVEDKIYVLDDISYTPVIRVYENQIGFAFIEGILLEGGRGNDIIYSNESKNVYISDFEGNCIWVLTTLGKHRTRRWLDHLTKPDTLSLSNEGHLLVLRDWKFDRSAQLEIYSLNATLIRLLPLPDDVRVLHHVVQTSAGNFIICHAHKESGLFIISELANNGSLLKRFHPRNKSEELNQPLYMSLDSDNNRLFVADYFNDRVILFDSTDLTWSQVVVSRKENSAISHPSRLLYDSEKKRLFIAQQNANVGLIVYEIN